MTNVENKNSIKYYLVAVLLSIIYGLINTIIINNATNIDIFLFLQALGFSIGLFAISVVISVLICSIKMIFTKKWENFSKILFYTNLIYIIFMYIGSILS
jgi:hypothetical protein